MPPNAPFELQPIGLPFSYSPKKDPNYGSGKSGNDMDEERKKAVAYEYLCHLEEAKVTYKNRFLLFVTLVSLMNIAICF